MTRAAVVEPGRERLEVEAGYFVPCLDNYYQKLLLLARRYFRGERELLLI